MFDNNPQPNWIYDLETLSFLEVNEAAMQHYGYSREEFLAMTIKDIRPPEDIPSLMKDIELTFNVYHKAGEWRHVKKNGELIYVEINSRSMLYNGKDSRHVLIHDITDRKLTEEALKQANDELERLHNNLDEAVYSVDMILHKMLYVSVAHQTVFGHSPAEFFINPQLWYDIIVPEDKPIVDAGFPVLYSGKKLRHEYRIADSDGKTRWIEAKMNPTLDEDGKLTRIDGVATDITQRKRIEVELLELELNFRRSISESPVGIRIVSVEGNTIYANKAFLDIYEFNSLEEFTSTPALHRYTPGSYRQHLERKKKRKEGVEVFDYEIRIICKNQDVRYVKVSRKEVLWNGTKHFQLINIDITEQRQAEEQLREDVTAKKKMLQDLIVAKEHAEESELFLRTFIENIPFEVWVIDVNNVGILENKKLADHFGSIVGNIPKLNAKMNTSTVELWKSITRRVMNGEIIDEEHADVMNHQQTIYQKIAFPIYNKSEIIGIAGFNINISERKRVEVALNNSEEQLRKFASHLQNVREEEKIALAREIHDDLGQILVALKIDIGLLKNKVMKTKTIGVSEDILPKFENIVLLIDNTIKTARRIMNGLRPELLELHGFVGATKDYLREFEARHKLKSKFTCEVSNLTMTPQQALTFFRIVQEALSNIAQHARATSIKIRLSHSENKLRMEISDNGVGFDMTKGGREDSYGMLGMKERVILLQGQLNITSEPGKGTIVRVEIPYTE